MIESNEDYERALTHLEKIFDAKPETKAGHEAKRLINLIDKYENIHYPIEAPDVNIM